jgi:Tol biopolymer transport system component
VPGLDQWVSRARFSPDEKTAYVSYEDSSGFWHTAIATRPDVNSAFGGLSAPVELMLIGYSDYSPSATANGLDLYFESIRSNSWQLYVSRRTSISGRFSFPQVVAPGDLGTALQRGGPYVVPSGGALYFHASPAANSELYRAEHGPNGFAEPTPVDGANSEWIEQFPVVTPDELTIYFESDRPGGSGDFDIWVVSRSSTSEPFSQPTPLTSLNTASADIPSWVSADGCRLYFDRSSQFWADNRILVAERVRDGAASTTHQQ